ncbi:MAG: DNA topoisomerase IB [Solirubrobacteraceae bacterium]
MATAATPTRPRRLRRSNPGTPGYARRRCGTGFIYLDETGARITDAELVARITALVIPPAWKDAWISPDPFGHIQATGIDARGRTQYLYHPRWRERRDQQKFDDMVAFARRLPALRALVEHDLALGDMSREQVLACATRLLDRGLFRIGSEQYAVTNETYGLATMRKRHVTLRGDTIGFDYIAKEGKRRVQAIVDPEVAAIVGTLKRRRGGGDDLLAYKRDRRWCDVRSPDINAYLKAATGSDISAKDFRTWGATVLAAVGLAVMQPAELSATARRRAIGRAVEEVAHYLGNTPAVARGSYIDPRVLDRFRAGETISLELVGAGATAIQGPVEEAVLELLAD